MKQKLKSSSKNIITVILALILSMGAFLIPAAAENEDSYTLAASGNDYISLLGYYPSMSGAPFGFRGVAPSGTSFKAVSSGDPFFGIFGNFFVENGSSLYPTPSRPSFTFITNVNTISRAEYRITYSGTVDSGYYYLYIPYTDFEIVPGGNNVYDNELHYITSYEVIDASMIQYPFFAGTIGSSYTEYSFNRITYIFPGEYPTQGSYIKIYIGANTGNYRDSIFLDLDLSSVVNPYAVSESGGGGDSDGGTTEVTISYFSIVLAMLLAVLLVLGFFII